MRIALHLEYDGKNFCGSQYQEGVRTVQADLEAALSTYLRCAPLRVVLAGRTDSGVHASGMIAHFDLPEGVDAGGDAGSEGTDRTVPKPIDLWRLCWASNGILKNDISVVSACIVPNQFHARFAALERTYVYRILNRPQRSALDKERHFFVPHPLDLESMQEASAELLGTHDFVAFRSTNADKTSTLCDVRRSEILNLGEGELEFWISANHFVYNMVRIIVGTLVEIGLGKRPKTRLTEALSRKDRELAGPTAPPWGLTLVSIKYPQEYKLFETENNHIPVPPNEHGQESRK
jgi:tRNA pseudouridine38-40 synthase